MGSDSETLSTPPKPTGRGLRRGGQEERLLSFMLRDLSSTAGDPTQNKGAGPSFEVPRKRKI